ncbi:max-binding protein MNT-like isoform X2 [Brienomyrus brachyistius]|uniref:max-binding protein MNT-like isoform X2 n=1 Tax=Brienomyrus brachyistius TaxID=42636 RepID=UPI0020B19E23|nr:max-binding protein MNT-like isoform X2 [Brienomyrus brachyistius]
MSIETLLEAAKFLEWQSQQQQKAREESELKEKLRLEREAEQKRTEVVSALQPPRLNHGQYGEELRPEPHSLPVTLRPPPVSIAVIPIPMMSAGPVAPAPPLAPPPPGAALSPSVVSRPSPPRKDAPSPPAQPPQLPQRLLLASQLKVEAVSSPQAGAPKQQQQQQQQQQAPPPLVQPYPGSIITASQHALLPQPAPLPVQPNPAVRLNTMEDSRHPDGKRRPGGRAHLKECFETLKKNIPNVDEKKTSNLSVLRSALRYIQTLKRKEKEYEHEMERLAREKIATQQRLAELKNELGQWMDVMEVDRVLRQTVQPDDDQASTSTASEGEDNIDEDMDEGSLSAPPMARAAPAPQTEQRKPATGPQPILTPHLSVQHKPPQLLAQPAPAQAMVAPQAIPQGHLAQVAGMQPTVITHAAAAPTAPHASVIQAVNHVIQPGPKHVAHIAPSPSNPVSLAPAAAQPISHITVTHLGQPLPALYPQPVAVSQPAVVSHLAHTLSHGQVNGGAPQGAMVGKQAAMGAQVVTHHPQLVGQTVLNPVTMVTMPSFPVSTLKLA